MKKIKKENEDLTLQELRKAFLDYMYKSRYYKVFNPNKERR